MVQKSRIRGSKKSIILFSVGVLVFLFICFFLFTNKFSADAAVPPSGVPANSYQQGKFWLSEKQPPVPAVSATEPVNITYTAQFFDAATKKAIEGPLDYTQEITYKRCTAADAAAKTLGGCSVKTDKSTGQLPAYRYQLLGTYQLFKLETAKYDAAGASKGSTFSYFVGTAGDKYVDVFVSMKITAEKDGKLVASGSYSAPFKSMSTLAKAKAAIAKAKTQIKIDYNTNGVKAKVTGGILTPPSNIAGKAYRCGINWCVEYQEPKLVDDSGYLTIKFVNSSTKKDLTTTLKYFSLTSGKYCAEGQRWLSTIGGCGQIKNSAETPQTFDGTKYSGDKFNFDLYYVPIDVYNSTGKKIKNLNLYFMGYEGNYTSTGNHFVTNVLAYSFIVKNKSNKVIVKKSINTSLASYNQKSALKKYKSLTSKTYTIPVDISKLDK